MKVLIINEFCGTGSTGKISVELAKELETQGDVVKIAFGRDGFVPEEYKRYAVRIGNDFSVRLHGLDTRLFDAHGFGSKMVTKQFLRWADDYNPDLVWLHNIHGYYINIVYLFNWIKSRPSMQVNWTLHDCWAFTGHCPHFVVANCYRWMNECHNCPQLRRYPASLLLDNSKRNYTIKKELFTGIQKIQIFTPSRWLADFVSKSFLKEYPVNVVHNTVNTEVFKPVESSFRCHYHLQGKKILLGVASVWNDDKGLNSFYDIAQQLQSDYVVVLVGLTDAQISKLSGNMLGIKRTHSQKELVEIYSASDLFLNLSREETYGMTVAEAILCGTVPIVYEGTACEEVVKQYHCGFIVEPDINAVMEKIAEYFLYKRTYNE